MFLKRGLGCSLQIPFWKNDVVQKVLAHADQRDAIDTFNMGLGWVAIVSPEQADDGGEVRHGRGHHRPDAQHAGSDGGSAAGLSLVKREALPLLGLNPVHHLGSTRPLAKNRRAAQAARRRRNQLWFVSRLQRHQPPIHCR